MFSSQHILFCFLSFSLSQEQKFLIGVVLMIHCYSVESRSIINWLKSDMESLQEEIKAQLAEFESFKMEYANARLECNTADERANILASEVIGLEEKASEHLWLNLMVHQSHLIHSLSSLLLNKCRCNSSWMMNDIIDSFKLLMVFEP
ncbi:hypothetical protein GOBAR_DD36187 [Gossypium barbadense]|nr:hypothetical protein GOBAR_DD36187 [Gossypium barbadense]